MMQTASKYSVVHCDICGDPMQKQTNGWACYECNNWVDARPIVYESDTTVSQRRQC